MRYWGGLIKSFKKKKNTDSHNNYLMQVASHSHIWGRETLDFGLTNLEHTMIHIVSENSVKKRVRRTANKINGIRKYRYFRSKKDEITLQHSTESHVNVLEPETKLGKKRQSKILWRKYTKRPACMFTKMDGLSTQLKITDKIYM